MSWLRCLVLLVGFAGWLSLGAIGCGQLFSAEPRCPTGYSDCDGFCFDLQNSRTHCGSCQRYCEYHESCRLGRCGLHCAANETVCADRCVDLLSNRNHCGACGNACFYSQSCVSGKCLAPCKTGYTDCFGDCIDTKTNDRHCGSCDNLCQGGTTCLDSLCQCPSYLVFCTGWCTDIRRDSNHCGKCSAQCRSHEKCVDGLCQFPAIRSVSAGYWATCALSHQNVAKCWGYNRDGKLGYGDTTDRNKPDSVAIDMGSERTALQILIREGFACVLLDNQTLKCWGDNRGGILGYDDKVDRNRPGILPIDLGPARTAKAVAAGYDHICAILDNGGVKCWGDNSDGQLGYGDTTYRSKPDIQPIDLGPGRTALSISAGARFTCALLDNGTVKCWGDNSRGQLGYRDTNPRSKPDAQPVDLGAGRTVKTVVCNVSHVCVLLDDGSVKCWGNNSEGQLGYGRSDMWYAPDTQPIILGIGRTAQSIAVGYHHTCAVLDDRSLKCWGSSFAGQLGYGVGSSAYPPEHGIDLGKGRTALSVSAGYDHTCAVLDDGSLKCWGGNKYGQLGYGDDKKRNQPDSEAVPF